MKHAKIYNKNDYGVSVYVGEAILLNCLDPEFTRGFWEYRFIEGDTITHCDWIANKDVFEVNING